MSLATPEQLRRLLEPVRHLLLDFDGPVCAVFAGLPAPVVAERLRSVAARSGFDVPVTPETALDPIAVFRQTAGSPDAAASVERALAEAELDAVPTAAPTQGADELLRACRSAGIAVAVVTNNSSSAVLAYLRSRGLADLVAAVVGRAGDPALLKPDAWSVRSALAVLSAQPTSAVMLGDSPADVGAARAADVPVIGLTNKPGKSERLQGADAIVPDVIAVASAIAPGEHRGIGT